MHMHNEDVPDHNKQPEEDELVDYEEEEEETVQYKVVKQDLHPCVFTSITPAWYLFIFTPLIRIGTISILNVSQ